MFRRAARSLLSSASSLARPTRRIPQVTARKLTKPASAFSRTRFPYVPSRQFSNATASAHAPFFHASAFDVDPILKSLGAYPRTQVSALKNGVRVATERASGHTATIGVWIDTGSRYEGIDPANNGVAHFLEHMFFKGTQQRSVQQFEKEIESMGGHLNAYTSREHTVFYFKVGKNDVKKALGILSDILLNPVLDPAAIDRERDVIIREMQEVESQMEEVVFDRLHMTAYRGSTLGRTILGPKENIEKINRDQLLKYIQQNYTANRMVVAGCGDFNHEDIVQQASELFANVPGKAPYNNEGPYIPALFTGSEYRARFDDMGTAHVAVAWETDGWADYDNPSMLVLQNILGSWNKHTPGGIHSASPVVSRLARSKAALSYSTFHTPYQDTGLFGFYLTAEPMFVEDAMAMAMEEAVRHCYTVSADLVEAAKHQIAVSAASALEGTSTVAEEIGRQMLTYGRRVHPIETMTRLASVDQAAVRNAAKRYLQDQDVAVVGIGPVWEMPTYDWTRRRTYSIRF